jgi:hypothetical protein
MRVPKTHFEQIPVETVKRIAKELPETSAVQAGDETAEYIWQESYRAALLETDWTKMQERIQAAESAIHERQRVLSEDHRGTSEERQAIACAIGGLKTLRREVAEWQYREPPVAQAPSLPRPVSWGPR